MDRAGSEHYPYLVVGEHRLQQLLTCIVVHNDLCMPRSEIINQTYNALVGNLTTPRKAKLLETFFAEPPALGFICLLEVCNVVVVVCHGVPATILEELVQLLLSLSQPPVDSLIEAVLE